MANMVNFVFKYLRCLIAEPASRRTVVTISLNRSVCLWEPLKQLLILWGLKDIADQLPKKVPLDKFNWIDKHGFSDPKDWTLITTTLMEDLQKMLPGVDLSPIKEPLKVIEKEFHYLPTELIRYLDMSLANRG